MLDRLDTLNGFGALDGKLFPHDFFHGHFCVRCRLMRVEAGGFGNLSLLLNDAWSHDRFETVRCDVIARLDCAVLSVARNLLLALRCLVTRVRTATPST